QPIRTADSDAFFKTYFEPDKLEQAYESGPPEVMAMLRGYAAGANRYLADGGLRDHPGSCADAPWIAPLTVRDVILMVAEKAVLSSGLLFAPAIVNVRPPDGSGSSDPGG